MFVFVCKQTPKSKTPIALKSDFEIVTFVFIQTQCKVTFLKSGVGNIAYWCNIVSEQKCSPEKWLKDKINQFFKKVA